MKNKENLLYKIGKFNEEKLWLSFVIVIMALTILSFTGLDFSFIIIIYIAILFLFKRSNNIYTKNKKEIEEK